MTERVPITLRMPRSLHHRLSKIAEDRGISLNDLIVEATTQRAKGPRIKHLKRGSTYELLGDASVQISTRPNVFPGEPAIVSRQRIVSDGDPISVYRSEDDGALYARFPDEFTPNRFEEL